MGETKQDPRGHELKYALYIRYEKEGCEIPEDEAIEIANAIMRKAFKTEPDVVDWDGPL